MRYAIKAVIISLMFSQNLAHALPITPVKYWATAEYLYWSPNDATIDVPLATKNTAGSLAIIGQPGTDIVLGAGSSNNHFNFHGMSGARVILGAWLDNAPLCGLELSVFSLAPRTKTLVASSGAENPMLDVPFYATQTNSENVLVGGRTNTITDKNTFQPTSVEINALYRLPRTPRMPIILSAGIRYMNIDDRLIFNDAIYGTPSLPPNSVLNVEDEFNARNHFIGLQVGARTKIEYCNVSLEAKGEVALGINYQKLAISGQANVSNQSVLQDFGLFTEPSNIGTYKNDQLAILPELELKMSFNNIDYLRPFITYDVIYMNNVNRASKQIDRNINQSQNVLLGGTGVLVGTPSPVKSFNQSHLWLQGVSLGVEFG